MYGKIYTDGQPVMSLGVLVLCLMVGHDRYLHDATHASPDAALDGMCMFAVTHQLHLQSSKSLIGIHVHQFMSMFAAVASSWLILWYPTYSGWLL